MASCWGGPQLDIKLKMAMAAKRQLGCSVKWIGARYYSLGLVVVTKDKRLKVLQSLLLLIQGRLNCGDLRSLNGLLEFIMVVRVLKRNGMAGMYEPFQSGQEAEKGPETMPRVNTLMKQSSWAWAAGCLGFGLHCPPPPAPPGDNPPFRKARFGYLVRKLAP